MRIYEYIQAGGWIMYILVIFNIIGLAIMASKFFIFRKQKKKSSEIADKMSDQIRPFIQGKGPDTIIEITKQEIAAYISNIERGLNTIKIIASVSPLLGLLGTVLGVLVAFQIMAQKGMSDPSFFAQGISMALITTVGGMIVAIPHLIGHNYLVGVLDNIESNLEKKILRQVL